jgi:hypothetical protein
MNNVDFTGWSRKWMADGFMLFPPEGRSVGGLRVQDRIRPLRTVRHLVDHAVKEGAVFINDIQVGKLRKLVTLEGEYACIITMAGRRKGDGLPVERTLGLVFAEDFFSRVDGIMQLQEQFESFRGRIEAITRNLSLGLGAVRRRRFLYTPPAGWQGLARTFRSDWIPHDYPRDNAMIQVFHAKPFTDAPKPQVAFERMLREDLGHGLQVEPYEPAQPIEKHPGELWGEITRVTGHYPGGPRMHFDLAVLADERFLYVLRLESDDAKLTEHRAVFRALVDSVRPLPAPSEQHESAASSSTHWAT